MRIRAVILDFNGTLSDDEPIVCRIFQELFAEHGRPLPAERYYDELVGLSDAEIVARWLGDDHPALAAVIEQRVARYRAIADGSTVREPARRAVRYAAALGRERLAAADELVERLDVALLRRLLG